MRKKTWKVCDQQKLGHVCSDIWMVSNNDGMVAPTKPFNEYMLVSYLAMAEEKTGTNALG